jgi:hypothetical protein
VLSKSRARLFVTLIDSASYRLILIQFNGVHEEARRRVDEAASQATVTSSAAAQARHELHELRAAAFVSVLNGGGAASLPAPQESDAPPPFSIIDPTPPPTFSPIQTPSDLPPSFAGLSQAETIYRLSPNPPPTYSSPSESSPNLPASPPAPTPPQPPTSRPLASTYYSLRAIPHPNHHNFLDNPYAALLAAHRR